MFGEKFATRLNSFKSKPEFFVDNVSSSLGPEWLVERAGTVKGLTDLDLNFPDHAGKNLKNIVKLVKDKGLDINGFAMRYYTNPNFKLGAFTNPDKKVRQEAIDLTKKGIDAARESNSNLMTIWLGQDGYDYGFQVDYKKIWQEEINGIREVALHDKDCEISIEYKPNEPRAYSLLANLSLTLLAIKEIDLPNLGVTLDFAHILYADEQPAFAAAMVSRNSKILGLHLNDGYAKRDDGLMVGSVHQLATIELLYQVYKDGYNGTIYFDTFPDASGLDPVKECEANINTVKRMLKVVKKLSGDNNLSLAIQNQDAVTSNQIFNKALYNLNTD
jgi:xylose isomerase